MISPHVSVWKDQNVNVDAKVCRSPEGLNGLSWCEQYLATHRVFIVLSNHCCYISDPRVRSTLDARSERTHATPSGWRRNTVSRVTRETLSIETEEPTLMTITCIVTVTMVIKGHLITTLRPLPGHFRGRRQSHQTRTQSDYARRQGDIRCLGNRTCLVTVLVTLTTWRTRTMVRLIIMRHALPYPRITNILVNWIGIRNPGPRASSPTSKYHLFFMFSFVHSTSIVLGFSNFISVSFHVHFTNMPPKILQDCSYLRQFLSNELFDKGDGVMLKTKTTAIDLTVQSKQLNLTAKLWCVSLVTTEGFDAMWLLRVLSITVTEGF